MRALHQRIRRTFVGSAYVVYWSVTQKKSASARFAKFVPAAAAYAIEIHHTSGPAGGNFQTAVDGAKG